MMKVGKVGKQRTRSGAKKRVRRTDGGTGKAVISKAGNRHLLLQKSKKQKGRKVNPLTLPSGEAKKVVKMMI